MKCLISAGLLIVLITICSCDTKPDYAYTYWDTNVDKRIDEEEFNNVYGEIGYYEGWDLNDDDLIDREEWDSGISEYYPDYDLDLGGTYQDWDSNNDEFIGKDEYLVGSYSLWDVDGNGFVEEVEYDENYYSLK